MVTRDMAGSQNLENEEHGGWLVKVQPFLREWYRSLGMLESKWDRIVASEGYSSDTFHRCADLGTCP
ncbi:hypothetical protein BDP27DRAFT_1327778 [Rhodocollybia butyracea]|uniref:Uncharacterized protein n=1 Tax=Rhodocollybia butyracea TaxID=206335 RepID=A0A9P5PS52_9AGAR|nr:hypothetical protein BDP27DRAFT_1327778 [Rhodocollybia butyracea]